MEQSNSTLFKRPYGMLLFAIIVTATPINVFAQWYKQYLKGVGKKPTIFQPAIISTDSVEFNTSFCLAIPEFYFTRVEGRKTSIFACESRNNVLLEPRKIAFGESSPVAGDVHVQADGRFLYVTSNGELMRSTRNGATWGPLEPVPSIINAPGREFYPITTATGNLYFGRNGDIHVLRFVNGVYEESIPVPGQINTPNVEADAWVSPDETFMVFVRMDGAGGYGKSDLYISFFEKGEWQTPKNMGSSINSTGIDGSPFVSPDGQFLFFTSGRNVAGRHNRTGDLNLFAVRFHPKYWK